MCNELHEDYTPIPPEGIGWKLFWQDLRTSELFGLVGGVEYKNECKWLDSLYYGELNEVEAAGFNFFLDKEEAERALAAWIGRLAPWERGSKVMRKIRYKGGLGVHSERSFVSREVFRVALCKEFEVSDA